MVHGTSGIWWTVIYQWMVITIFRSTINQVLFEWNFIVNRLVSWPGISVVLRRNKYHQFKGEARSPSFWKNSTIRNYNSTILFSVTKRSKALENLLNVSLIIAKFSFRIKTWTEFKYLCFPHWNRYSFFHSKGVNYLTFCRIGKKEFQEVSF